MGERLGQHFLKNKSIALKSIEALDLSSGEIVIEIGPGEGALTFPLLEKCRAIGCKLVAIETDHELAEKLNNSKIDGLEVIEGDVLNELPKIFSSYGQKIGTHKLKIIGNIPYYITGQILRTIGDLDEKPSISILMTQKEVAERVCSTPPKMNLLAAAIQIWAETSIIARLKPKDFDPPPKVDSAVIKLKTRAIPMLKSEEIGQYYRLIRLIFKQPRKTALNNLADGLEIEKNATLELMKSVGLTGLERPQNLSLDQLIKLSTKI